jgi:membrane fusion protein (multidrug efflux system)
LALFGLASACGSGGEEKGKGKGPPPLVKVEPAQTMRFVETVEAVGTANANEQVTITAQVTERLVRLGFDDGSFVRRGQTSRCSAQGQQTAALAEANARQREAQQQLAGSARSAARLRHQGERGRADRRRRRRPRPGQRRPGPDRRAGDHRALLRLRPRLRNISPGAVVNSGTEIATISDISTIKLDFPVPETALAAIRPGLTIDGAFRRLSGHAVPRPDRHRRSGRSIPTPAPSPCAPACPTRRRLKPGMLLTVGIETAPRMGLSVPELAVVGEGERRFVYRRRQGHKAKRVEVRTGLRASAAASRSSKASSPASRSSPKAWSSCPTT